MRRYPTKLNPNTLVLLKLNVYNNVRYILYNNDVITNIVKSIVPSPVGKLV